MPTLGSGLIAASIRAWRFSWIWNIIILRTWSFLRKAIFDLPEIVTYWRLRIQICQLSLENTNWVIFKMFDNSIQLSELYLFRLYYLYEKTSSFQEEDQKWNNKSLNDKKKNCSHSYEELFSVIASWKTIFQLRF